MLMRTGPRCTTASSRPRLRSRAMRFFFLCFDSRFISPPFMFDYNRKLTNLDAGSGRRRQEVRGCPVWVPNETEQMTLTRTPIKFKDTPVKECLESSLNDNDNH